MSIDTNALILGIVGEILVVAFFGWLVIYIRKHS